MQYLSEGRKPKSGEGGCPVYCLARNIWKFSWKSSLLHRDRRSVVGNLNCDANGCRVPRDNLRWYCIRRTQPRIDLAWFMHLLFLFGYNTLHAIPRLVNEYPWSPWMMILRKFPFGIVRVACQYTYIYFVRCHSSHCECCLIFLFTASIDT